MSSVSYRSMLVLGGALVLMSGCKSRPEVQPAPVQAGNFIEYKGEERDVFFTVRMQFNADEGTNYRITAKGANVPPFTVDNALRPTDDNRIDVISLGMLYLPPSLRKIGAPTTVGTVSQERRYSQWNVWVVAERGGVAGERYYDKATGLLVGMENRNTGARITLLKSDITGLM